MYEIILYETEDGRCPVEDFLNGKRAILTNGFIKNTNKTPKTEIDTAMKYREDYERQMKDEKL